MTGREIRQKFLKYFEEKGHTIVKSSSLVPRDDPTLMFTNAGMVQFKSVFLGEDKRPYSRATSSQKCLRVSGKHNDLENVGRTARHHTFFEMLGNFSFGDYFKEEAIHFGWEFLVERMGLPADRIWISIFREDDEAFEIWRKYAPAGRIARMEEKDNFWAMGPTGPCGPCSEIILDQGPEVGCGRDECNVFCSCDRHLELWNLVFMQFNQFADGHREPLPRPSIDTGMGLERLAAVLQGQKSNFHCDLFADLFEQIQSLSGKNYGRLEDDDVSMRVIADHSRATAFLIGDGVIPSNEGRGYELRRIMRRALRHGKMLGIKEPFLYRIVETVARVMQDAYPGLIESLEYICRVTFTEEERFLRTLERGMALIAEETQRMRQEHAARIPGAVIFRLYDTFGFPVDLTAELAAAEGLTLDMDGFQQAMDEQRQRSREHWAGSGSAGVEEAHRAFAAEGIRTKFTGYETLEDRGRALRIASEGNLVEEAQEGQRVEVVTDVSPFYGQAGGQVGDTGMIEGPAFIMEVENTAKPLEELIVHQGIIKIGKIRTGDPITLRVNSEHRYSTMRNHSATHLLQWALRTVLGDHVKQSGSEVSPHGLRFDFTHMTPLTPPELDSVEDLVNQRILENHPVRTTIMPFEEALKTGAIAIFEEKYGDQVRLVDIGGLSRELCGGTHVRATGDIGAFKIVREGSIGASLRRIEALTGKGALARFREYERVLQKSADILRSQPAELADRLHRTLERQRELEREVETLRSRLAALHTGNLMDRVRELDGVRVLSARVEARTPRELREISDHVRDRLRPGVIVLAAVEGGKVFLVAMVRPELTMRLSAVEIIRAAAGKVGGAGGGRAEIAQAGGHRPEGLSEALEEVYRAVERILKA